MDCRLIIQGYTFSMHDLNLRPAAAYYSLWKSDGYRLIQSSICAMCIFST
ncbi:MAG: hypothetical protein JXA46_09390 [Dehalococcoidales bacterium]|nr:hypothetical protein [Dehalococcoidales bacterium]